MKGSSLARVAGALRAVLGTSLYSQGQSQTQALRPARARADETLEVWTGKADILFKQNERESL
jgi:hypothetical protein